LDAGTVWINTYGPTDTRLPWGGMGGRSGIGRDLGRVALDNNTEQKDRMVANAHMTKSAD
jgi:aldehyde dehydrogenase (NAD+)